MCAGREQPNPTLVDTSLYCKKMSLLWRLTLNDKYQIHMSLMLMIINIMMCRIFPQINMSIQHTLLFLALIICYQTNKCTKLSYHDVSCINKIMLAQIWLKM